LIFGNRINLRQILKNSQLFSGFDDQSLEEVLLSASKKIVAKDEIIFYEKDIATSFYIVGSGKVKVFKLSPEGKEQILMIANPGDSFAEAALFAVGKYPASAQALEDSTVVVFNRDRFVGLVERNPHIALNLIARLATLLHKLNRLVEDLSLTDITTRLAYYLVQLIEEKQIFEEPIKLTLSEKKLVLASQLGTIPETLSRSFAKLTKDKIISVNGSHIEVHNLQFLRQLAGVL